MRRDLTKNLVLAGLFVALGYILPFVTGHIPSIGNMLLPMHIPVLIAGFVLGGKYGLIIGFIVPILRSLTLGMPPLFPTAIAMAFELATYGLMTGLLYRALSKKKINIYVSLIGAMLIGRLVWGAITYVLLGLNGTAFTFQMFIAGAFVNAVVGIVLQILIVPPIIMALKSAGHLVAERGY